jgi:hypothetical protein
MTMSRVAHTGCRPAGIGRVADGADIKSLPRRIGGTHEGRTYFTVLNRFSISAQFTRVAHTLVCMYAPHGEGCRSAGTGRVAKGADIKSNVGATPM